MKPRNKIQPLPFVLPALIVYILTVIIPILWSMGYSLFSWNGISDMKFIGLENYVRMFQDETFREAVVNNLKFVVLGSLFQLCAGLILAILLTHISKGGNILRVIYFIPCIISSMAICQIFSKMLSVQPQGLVCYVMEKLGMEPIALLAFSIVIVMLVNGCLKTFDVFYILDNKSRSTEMVATYMYKTAFNSADFGYGSTLSVFLVIECLVAVGIIQKCLGSAKGDESE